MTTGGITDDSLYDRYLEACCDGLVETPTEFFDRHPGIEEDTRASIEALHKEMAGTTGRPALERLGDCEILRPLDHGGMGLVYLARQQPLGRLVVVKVIRPELRGSRTARERFRREAAAASKLNHPNLVQVIGEGEQDGVAFLIMEYVPGRSLTGVLATRPAWSQCVRWVLQLARALGYAHAEGVVHRDVKPSNIRLDRAGLPKLLDFGVARTEDATAAGLTTTFAGSPLYAAPEQLTGASLDGRADVYALGVTLYECVTGRVPFPGTSLEQVLREVLADDPVPPRRLEPALPRDLESVLLKAIEKDPARRYASAGAFADDLEALLDDRPVRARPPSAWRRTTRWARRHPAGAVAVALTALLIAGTMIWNVWQARVRAINARAAVVEARGLLEDYRRHQEETQALENRLAVIQQQIEFRYLTPEEDTLLNASEIEVERRWREREAMFYEVLDRLRRAERLDPEVAGTNAVRAEMFAEKWRLAATRQDPVALEIYRELVAKHDPSGRLAAQVDPPVRLRIETMPPGAEVYLFDFVELEHEPRLVPVPVGGTMPVAKGTLCLRVRRPAGPFRVGDIILAGSCETGQRVRVYRDGAVRERVVPAGLDVRPTAAPLFPGPSEGRTPVEVTLHVEPRLILVRAPGYLPVRVYARPAPVPSRLKIRLRESAPEGFVFVMHGVMHAAPGSFWASEREVTALEYLAFLNGGGVARPSRLWKKKNGRFVLPEDVRPDWPALGVGFSDALAYAAWRTARDPGWRYALPTYADWMAMGGGRLYPYGSRFRPKWASSCYARPQAGPVPVMSYPIDVSVYGIHDMSGSAREWLLGWYDQGLGLRRVAGGSWGQTPSEMFKIPGGTGLKPEYVSGDIGMRLVARPR